jgi:hypothetical protein
VPISIAGHDGGYHRLTCHRGAVELKLKKNDPIVGRDLMTLRKYTMVCSLVTCMSATAVSAGDVGPVRSSNDNALLAVAIVAIAGLIGWSLTQNGGGSGGDPNTSTKGSVPGKDKGKLLMEF